MFDSDDNAPFKMDKYDCPNSLSFLGNPEISLNLSGEHDERFETFNDIKLVKHVRIYVYIREVGETLCATIDIRSFVLMSRLPLV